MFRRDLLVRTGLTFAAGALASSGLRGPAAAEPLIAPSQAQEEDWESVRAEFTLTPDFLHFGGLLLASHPAPVRAAIEAHRYGLDANPVHYLHAQGPLLEAGVLRAAAAYLGTRPDEIALTDSTTMGLGLLYNGLAVGAGQELLTTHHDFFATHEALRWKADRSGATVRAVPLYRQLASVSADEIVQAIADALTPDTRVVALTWVHSSTGLKLPIRRIADHLAEVNAGRDEVDRALLCVDGVHGLGVEDVTLPALGADFFVAGTHKWLFGPRGTGLVWGSPHAWPAATPTIPAFGGGSPGAEFAPGGFHSFEHRWALAAAFDFHRRIGKTRIADRIHQLNRQLKEGLAQIPGVTVHTPFDDDLSAGLVVFDIQGLSTRAVEQRLRERGIIATATPYTPSYPRLAPGLLNTPDEVDAVLRAVRDLA